MDERINWASWRELEASPMAYGNLNAHRLQSSVVVLAVDHEGRRHVLLSIPSLDVGVTDAQSRGLSITTRELEVEGKPASPFIDLCCTDVSSLDAFDVVATTLAKDVDAGIPPGDAVRETITRWRRFWGAVPLEGLQPAEVRGLFGELWFLLVWLLPHGPEMVKHWVGPMAARDDFQWPGLSIEAKTTTSIRGHVHTINGLDQLDPPDAGSLQLFSLRIRDELAAANSLVTLVASVTELVAEHAELLDLFESRLASAGYSPAHEDRYREMRFRIVNERLYRVDQDFPRLSASLFHDGVPRGVERVEYDINLEGFPELISAATPRDFTPPQ